MHEVKDGHGPPNAGYPRSRWGMQRPMTVDREVWLTRFAAALGVPPPTPHEIDVLLAVAGLAAHASERTAAPISAWIAGRSDLDTQVAYAVAERLSNECDLAEDDHVDAE